MNFVEEKSGSDTKLVASTLASPQAIKVLVADDSAVFRKIVEIALSDKHYTLIFAKNGREAIDLMEKYDPPLVIVDWVMPDLSGIEICEHIRSRPQEFYPYVIVLTGKSDKQDIVAALEAGADDYVTKPFDQDEFAARVKVGLRFVELRRQVEAKNALLQDLALTDSLTSLPNRRAIEIWASSHLSSAARHGFSFFVMMADLDHFKLINDTYGHEAGDTVLKRFAVILKTSSRRSDICGRMGGEEFLLAFTHSSGDGAQLVAERIRAQLESAEFMFGQQIVRVTASFGLAALGSTTAPDFNSLVRQADAALYVAKRRGRNRTETAISTPSA